MSTPAPCHVLHLVFADNRQFRVLIGTADTYKCSHMVRVNLMHQQVAEKLWLQAAQKIQRQDARKIDELRRTSSTLQRGF